MNNTLYLTLIFLICMSMVGCNNNSKHSQKPVTHNEKPAETVKAFKDFDEGMAYQFVKNQVDFGPRVPGSKAHKDCADYLYGQLRKFCDTVFVQNFKSRVFDGKEFDAKNIIGSFNLETGKRLLLCAHWDSRPFADYDENPENHNTPIDGANDGASGVGVLLEVARQLSISRPNTGVDIIFLDMEDYGPTEDYKLNSNTSTELLWGLGAQYWAKNPHIPGYDASYGILLDMVGNSNPTFLREQYSDYFAKRVVDKVWKNAAAIGYGNYFVNKTGGIVTDDHVFINQIMIIPTIDIIHQDFNSPNGLFHENWHTLKDDINCIDAKSLKIVGDVVLTTVMNE